MARCKQLLERWNKVNEVSFSSSEKAALKVIHQALKKNGGFAVYRQGIGTEYFKTEHEAQMAKEEAEKVLKHPTPRILQVDDPIFKQAGITESFDKEAANWYNNIFIPSLKKHAGGEYDPMMVHADNKGVVKVYTKMYKSNGVTSIQKAFKEVGIEVIKVQPNESSYRGSVTGQFPVEGIAKN